MDTTPLPTGTVTFLFTDIEGSSRLWEQHPQAMPETLAEHDARLRLAIEAHGGRVFKTVGDQFCAVFTTAPGAVSAALAAQRALKRETAEQQSALSVSLLRVRMALHTGAVEVRDADYFGPPLNRVARILETAHGDQTLLSSATQELVRDHLPEGASLRDVGQHRLKDLARREQLYQLVVPDLPSDFPPLRSIEIWRHHLPSQLTPLIGRERELETLKQMLQGEGARLVTLTGPGGTGKTRLGLQTAADLLDAFADGVFFVDLAPIRDPGLVLSAITQILGLQDSGDQPPIETLQDYLRQRQTLLLLDNFEQVLSAAPLVTRLLESCPRLHVLVTSRAPLRLRGEREFPVAPLAVPTAAETRQTLPAALSQYAAVTLFIQRAVGVKPGFAVTNENAPAVAELCHRLDGLPLAIELAAARTRFYSPQALLSRLERRLPLLTGGARDLPTRQQTLRGTIAWSHDLLGEEEQRLFRCLSVFVGGCTLEAVEAVCAGEPDLVATLVDQNLLRQSDGPEGEPRFWMLETIREFGQERLLESSEADAIHRQHAQYFLTTAEGLWDHEWRETEHDNLRAAWDWAVAAGEAEIGVRLGSAMLEFWGMRGYLTEGRDRTIALLGLPELVTRSEMRAKALLFAGAFVWLQADYEAADRYWGESLSICRELNLGPAVSHRLHLLGRNAQYQGDLDRARSLYEESLAIDRAFHDRLAMSVQLAFLGRVAHELGDMATARALCQEGVEILRTLPDPGWHQFADVVDHRAVVACAEGEFDTAQELCEEGLELRRKLGDMACTSISLYHMGKIAATRGDRATARLRYGESLTLRRELGERRGIAECLQGLAEVAEAEGETERAARLFGAAAALRDVVGAPMAPIDRAACDQRIAAARVALGEGAFAAAWAEGRAMKQAEVIRDALRESGADVAAS